MKFIIENITDEEMRLLEREGFEWYPDDINSNDAVINGDILYYRMAIRALRRKRVSNDEIPINRKIHDRP